MTIRLSHLAILLALSTLITAIGGVAATWWIADKEFRDVLGDDLENQSKLLAELVTSDGFNLTDRTLEKQLADAFENDDEETLWVTVYNQRDGTIVSNLDHDLPLEGENGSVRLDYDGYSWHGYREEEDHFVVQLMRRDDLYAEVQREILEDIITPALIGSGISLLLLALLIAFFLLPMTRLARQLETRSATSLEPVEVQTPAREIRLLCDSLNRLMNDVESVLTRERQFASDVAHELRTPLTTVKLELSGSDPDLAAVKSEVDRVSRLMEQLLTLARLEQGHWHRRFEAVSLRDTVDRVVERFAGKFLSSGMTLACRGTASSAKGDATLLDLLVQNLLQNVLVHCPPGTHADVLLDDASAGVRLRVSDDGPGIAADTRRQMAQSFRRLDSKSEGLGLGLAICHRIAEVHGAAISFPEKEDGSSGLVVEVTFPASSKDRADGVRAAE